MLEMQRINITLPKKLVKKSKVLVEEGLYSNFSELVRESIKNEILLDKSLIEKKRVLDKWFKEESINGVDTSSLSREEIINRIRNIRDKLWEEKYKKWFKEPVN